jgi:hypothetical protein
MNPALQSWLTIPGVIEKAIDGLSDADLDLRGGSEGASIRETVHHLVESNLIAANIMLAALASERTVTYDWSWVWPNVAWMQRMGYNTAPIAPALQVLRGLCDYYAVIIVNIPSGLSREVQLLDSPGAALYSKSVENILVLESKHVEEHLRDIAEIRAKEGK